MTQPLDPISAFVRPPVERRRSERHPAGTVGVLTLDESGKSIQVLVLNVSLHGAGFRAPCSLLTGAVHGLRIGTGPLHIKSTLEVVTCRRRHDGTYDIGGKFV